MSDDMRAETIKAGAKAIQAVNDSATSFFDFAQVAYDAMAPMIRAQTGRDIADAIEKARAKHAYVDLPGEMVRGAYEHAAEIARGVADAGGDTP